MVSIHRGTESNESAISQLEGTNKEPWAARIG